MPNVTERRGPPDLQPSGPLTRGEPNVETKVEVPGADAPKPPEVHADGVDDPKPADKGAEADAPRKALAQRLGTMGKRILKGAAILGLAAGLAVGGSVWLKQMQIQPDTPAVPIEVPVEIDKPHLPPGTAPPGTETHPQTPVTETAPGGLPSGPGTLPTLGEDPVVQPQTFSPHGVRLDTVLPPR